MSPNTERVFRLALERAELLEGNVDDLPSLETLRLAVDQHRPVIKAAEQASSLESWRESIEAFWQQGAQPKAIYDRLCLDHESFTGSLSAVKRLCVRFRKAQGVRPSDVAIPVITLPGQVAQVDFGSVGLLYDECEQRLRKAHVFVMVLGHSRHQFARFVFDQKLETWLALHVAAFDWFGGIPTVVVPDNLKSAVIRAAFDVRTEPVLNKSYRDFARHFGFQIDPTPAFSPEKKGKVESGIRYFKGSFMKTIGEERNINTLNRAAERWVRETAGMRMHGTTFKRPLEDFEATERSALLPHPKEAWQPSRWHESTVHRDCCVLIDKARYSVPFRLVGKKLFVRVTDASIEIYWEDARVATHSRGEPGSCNLIELHLPPKRGAYRLRDPKHWEARAALLGADVSHYIGEVFSSDKVLSQLSKVQAMVIFLEAVAPERANAACRRASFYGNTTLACIKNILKKELDKEPLPQIAMPSQPPLQQPRFARNVQELLNTIPKETDAPH